ncbi:MAG: SUMF1/EgtB/PvdO family nonheme iron enzyme [Chloroflexota bacterium]
MSNLIGQSLGRYHILEQLGEGGMAVVYKAYDTRLERDVAVKVIRRGAFPPDYLEQILKRFERESKALAKLFHPNIVKVLDFGNYEGSPFMVLEYSPSGTLKGRLGKPISWQNAIKLLIPIAHALEYAHEQGIIHRDVKPSNILFTKTNQPLLTDFGIAKILESGDATTLTGTGVGVGTPEYMAPEQWTGKASVRSDIYSLGVILYEMVTGRKPYVADTPAAILLKQATEPLPRPTLYAPGLPEGVEKILIKALARNPEYRFTSMAGFASAMENILEGQDVTTLTGLDSKTLRTESRMYTTVQQEDSRLTNLQDDTRDTMSMPHLNIKDQERTRTDAASRKKKYKLPISAFGLAALAGGLILITLICVAIAFITGIIDVGGKPLQASLPTSMTDSVSVGVPTDNLFLPSEPPPPTIVPTNTPLPIEITDKKGVSMRLVPAGTFVMGSENGNADEKPVRQVSLNVYYIDTYEVTNALYEACINEGVCTPPYDNSSIIQANYFGNSLYDRYPVVKVNWFQAKRFCEWRDARLPSEAEWEKAARGTDGRTYPWGEKIDCSYANYWGIDKGCVGDTTEVGSYERGISPYGLYDMAGNVWEWVADWYSDTFYLYSPFENPVGPSGGQNKILRGGSWNRDEFNVRVSIRAQFDPNKTHNYGIRCARFP